MKTYILLRKYFFLRSLKLDLVDYAAVNIC